MKLRIAALVAGALIGLSSAGGIALADNPHCLGNSDNIGLPNHHHVNDFPACGK